MNNKAKRIPHNILMEDEVKKRIFDKHGSNIEMIFYCGSAAERYSQFRCSQGHVWTTNAKGVYRGNGCWECGVISRGIKHRGSQTKSWKGGITILHKFVKGNLTQWKQDSMKNCNYQCIFTGSKDFHIHHLYPLNNIIQDALFELGLEKYEFIGNYSEEDIRPIIDKIIEIHYRYPLGVCIRNDIHKLFHKTRGKLTCTPEDFYEFQDKINSGEIRIDY